MKDDATLVAEGLHPLDVAWLQERVDALEGALREIRDATPGASPGMRLVAQMALKDDA